MATTSVSRLLPLLLFPGLGLLNVACNNHPVAPAPPAPAATPAPETAAAAEPQEASVEAKPETSYRWPHEMIEGEPMFKLMEHDDLPAIDAPVFVDAETADAFMDIDETVMGVVGKDGTAKCYSAWQLDSHEIVNDMLDGEAIAATW